MSRPTPEDDAPRPDAANSEVTAFRPAGEEPERRRRQAPPARLHVDSFSMRGGVEPEKILERRGKLIAFTQQAEVDRHARFAREADLARRAKMEREYTLERQKCMLPHQLTLLDKRQEFLFACEVVRSVSTATSSPAIEAAEKIADSSARLASCEVAKFSNLACFSAAASVAHESGSASGWLYIDLHVGDYEGREGFLCPGGSGCDRAMSNALSCLARAANIDEPEPVDLVDDMVQLDRWRSCYNCSAEQNQRFEEIYCDNWDVAHAAKWDWISNLFKAAYHFGKPFPGEWRTTSALSVARQIFHDRDFALMPILGDALEDAGCADDDLLGHLRNARGLWGRSDWALFSLVSQEMS